ncbi:hypothetical protein BH24ACT26_BH24ACT26_00600 [soil metagenome]
MRTLLKVHLPVEKGNEANVDGTLPKAIQSFVEKHSPEAMYFFPEGGTRTAIAVFDLQSPSQIPVVAEPFFRQFNAQVEFFPVMNIEDLQEGLQQLR